MMVFVLSSIFSNFLVLFSYFFPLAMFFSFIYFLSTPVFSFSSGYFFSFFLFDELSLFMVYMTFFVMYMSYFFALSPSSKASVFSLLFMFFFSVLVFVVNNVFMLYLFYEASLLPILYIIVKWGSYPERSVSALMLLIYTAVCSFPLLFFLFYYFSSYGSFYIPLNSLLFPHIPSIFSIIIFLAFCVKLPVYGLHFWLPMAHVEAPTFGSMILAGVLLKLGGVGLIRFSSFVDFMFLSSTFSSYLLVFLALVTIICCFQSDFKRMVAYSSVSHMMAIPILFLVNNLLSTKALVMLMFFHGLSSPVLFMLVGILYSFYSSRQLVVMRGLVLVSPLLSLICILAFFFTMSAPPFPSFVAEVFFFISSYQISVWFLVSVLFFTFLSLVYNLIWFSCISFSSPSFVYSSDKQLSFSAFFVFSQAFILCITFLILISFF